MNEFKKYSKDFEKILNFSNIDNSEIEQKENNYDWCYNCDKYKFLDFMMGVYVCDNCGVVSNNYRREEVGFLKDKPIYIFPYTRVKYFKKYINKSKHIPSYLEAPLANMFSKVNVVFKQKITNRRNFIKYSYLLNKLLHILKHPEIAENFKLPKRKKTLKKYDKIWSVISGGLNTYNCENTGATNETLKNLFFSYIEEPVNSDRVRTSTVFS